MPNLNNENYYKIPIKGNYDSQQVVYWENFLSDEDIDELLSYLNQNETKSAKIYNTNITLTVSNSLRNTQITWYRPCEENQQIWQKLTNAIAEVNRRFFHLDLTECEPAQLAVYSAAKDQNDTNGHYDWHWDMLDSIQHVPRKLSMSLTLSDPANFEGGNLEVMAGSGIPTLLEQRRGRAWFFPSYMLHRVTPVTQGHRCSLVIWVGGPSFK